MVFSDPYIFSFLESLIFATIVLMHVTKKNSSLVSLYALQSCAIVLMLFISSESNTILLLLAIFFIFFTKVLFAPYFFLRLIKKNKLTFTSSTYLNTPLTLAILVLLTAFSHSYFLKRFLVVARFGEDTLLLALAMIFASLFLIINRKGVLSQMLGILSLENGIVSFSALAGLEHSPVLQFGVIFDIIVWVTIATVFISMIYQKFGSLDVTNMA